MKRPVLLLTGFEPFGKWKRNASGEAVAAFDGETRPGFALRSLVLPVAWPRAEQVLEKALSLVRPVAVLSFGIHGKKKGAFAVETRATNELRFRIKDADGHRYRGRRIDPLGAPSLGTPLPATTLVAALKNRGLRARSSRNAGRFLCNAVYYRLLSQDLAAVFVHVPPREPDEPIDDILAAVESTTTTLLNSLIGKSLQQRRLRTPKSGRPSVFLPSEESS